jgi:hypothetical protein
MKVVVVVVSDAPQRTNPARQDEVVVVVVVVRDAPQMTQLRKLEVKIALLTSKSSSRSSELVARQLQPS